MGKRLGSLLLVFGTLLLTSCQSQIFTEVEVKPDASTEIEAVVRFQDEAADAINADKSIDQQIKTLYEDKFGVEVKRTSDENGVSFRAIVGYEDLIKNSSLTGISNAGIEKISQEEAAVNVTMVKPDDLLGAITAANSDQADADALTQTILETTQVGIIVSFPGEVTSSEGSLKAEVNGNRVESLSNLADFEGGTLTAQGSLVKPFWDKTKIIVASSVGGVFAVAAAWWLIRKRRS